MKVTLETVFTEAPALCDDLVQRVETRQKLLRLALYAALTGGVYGAVMGLYHSPGQALASLVKVPVLFLLTLAICLPSLHFLGLLFGVRVRFAQSAGVLVAGICRTSILLGAFAPIAFFFLVSGSDYPFLLLMHVGFFAFCGAAGLVTIHRDFVHVGQAVLPNEGQAVARWLLVSWMVLYMLVGTQMAYNLAPFVNQPGREVLLVNPERGNFFSYLAAVIFKAGRS